MRLAGSVSGIDSVSRMSKAADSGRAPFRRLSDSETLLFLTRTLGPRLPSAEVQDFSGKLQSLKDVLDRLETALLEWPDTPAKVRMWTDLAHAKRLALQMADDFADAAENEAGAQAAKSA